MYVCMYVYMEKIVGAHEIITLLKMWNEMKLDYI